MAEAQGSPPKPTIGIIADDLTGAAELAGVAWRFGYRSEVHTGCPGSTQAEVLSVDTDSRHRDALEAARRVFAATQHLQSLGVQWIYKKVDSVLRGNVVVELEAMLEALGIHCALLVPANPSLGRTIRNGVYFIGQVPINQSDFRNDPQHPRLHSQVLHLLGPSESVQIINRRAGEQMAGHGIIVGQASTAGDLQSWAKGLDSTILPAGAAEFFAAILASKHSPGQPPRPPIPSSNGNTLFVCGSMSAATREFLEDCRRRSVPVFPLPPVLLQTTGSAPEIVDAWAKEIGAGFANSPQVAMGIEVPLVKGKADRLSEILVAAAVAVIKRIPVARVNAEGGATAAVLISAMGWNRLRVMGEFSPGVVTLLAAQDSPVLLTIKPGSYRWPGALCQDVFTSARE